MVGIAKAIKFIMTLAALAGAVETIVRLAKFAWALVIKLQRIMSRKPMKAKWRMKFAQ